MAKACDNKSVGIIVRKDGAILVIERKKYNFGFAIPAGHQDGDDALTTAKKELNEEIGLTADELSQKTTTTLPNPCKRSGGTYHDWTIFEATTFSGEIKPSEDETKSYLWATSEQIASYTRRLEDFTSKLNIPLDAEHLPEIVRATNEDPAWKDHPGLEPPMYFLFRKLEII